MDRYWQELEQQRARHADPEAARIGCPLGLPPTHTTTSPRFPRAWQKYAAYPWLVWRATRREGVRVAHVLDHSYAHLLTRMPRQGVCKIVTVHDLAPLRDPAGLTEAQQRRFRRTVDCLHGADLLLADSSYSAGEVVSLLGVAPGKIQVLPLGVDVRRFAVAGAGAEFDGLAGRKVVLSVGATVARKNLTVLPEVFRRMNADKVTLVRIGGPLPAGLRAELEEVLGPGAVLELGAAPDEVLARAYHRADALIVPSLIEGFGFPVLEAMTAGCPVVCTNVTSLPEVGGDAALYFDPGDPAGAARQLDRLLGDTAWRGETVAAGRMQAARFSWATHFERLLEIYRAARTGL